MRALFRFKPCVGGLGETEDVAVVVGGLSRVADPKLDMMKRFELERIGMFARWLFGLDLWG